MTILIVEPAFPINSRTERFYQSFVEAFGEDSVKVACWNRDGRPLIKQPNYYIYDEVVGYGNPKAKLNGLRGFYKFIKQIVAELNPDWILASHWDSLIMAAMVKRRNTKIIYENLDMPTGKFPVRHMLRLLERWALTKTDCITFASRFFVPCYKSFKGRKFLVENKLLRSMCVPLPPKENKETVTISFLGVVRHAAIMENLMKAISGLKNVEFKVFGGGPFFEDIKNITDRYSNVSMLGPYEYKDIPGIYAQSDLIWAVYPYHDYNVKLAISNKYHETLHFGVPGIFCKGTKLGDMVAEEGIGLAVDCDSVTEIRGTIESFLQNKESLAPTLYRNLKEARLQENSCWEEEIKPFINYLSDVKG